MMRLSVLLAAACASPDGPSGPGDDGTPAPVEGREPALSADEAAAELQALADRAFPDPSVLREVYLSMIRAGEAACPGEDDQLEDGSIPLAGCTSESGYTYVGLSEYTEQDDAWALDLGDFYITDPDGHTFAVGGTFAWAGGETWSAEALGSFSYPAAEGWLGLGGSLALWIEGGEGWLSIDGGVGTLEAGGHLYFDELTWECGAQPAGGLRLRGPEGSWYRVDLDCSGCGPLTYAGDAALGEVCVDLSALGAALTTRLATRLAP